MPRSHVLAGGACAAPFVVFFLTYLPAAGHGFISDDFGWILHNRIRSLDDVARIALSDNGFYRPVVAFSFAFNELLFGLHARAYGVTNVMLAALCGVAVHALCRSLGLHRGAACLGAALWMLNLHGVGMGILWISGRTALMATAAAAGCAAALLRGRTALATALLALAVFSREETVLLPVVLGASAFALRDAGVDSRIPLRRWLIAGAVVMALYFTGRSTTGAMTPATAPPYYQFTMQPRTVLQNLGEYADRTSTFALAVALLSAVLLRPASWTLDVRTRSIVLCGAIWLGAFLGPALLLPVRSSLYACLPSVGICVAAAAVAERWWLHASSLRRSHALHAALIVSVLLWPILHARTDRWVGMAEFSSHALSDLAAATASLPDDSNILIVDDRAVRANMASVFSTLLRDAFLVTTGRYMTFYADPPIPNADDRGGGAAVCEDCIDLRLVVQDGRLVAR